MTGGQWAVLITAAVGAGAGVFLGAGADVTWASLTAPQYIFGSIVAISASIGAFFSKSPRQ